MISGLVQTFWFSFFQQVIPGVIDSNGKYTLVGLISTIVVVVLSITVAILKVYYDEKVYKDDISILESIYKGINESFSLKASDIYEHIRNYSLDDINHLKEVVTPEKQINSLINELTKALSGIVGIDEGYINTCLFYRLDKETFWHQDCFDHNVESLDELLNRPNSPVYYIIHNEEDLIFYSEKSEAVLDGKYKFNLKDDLNDRIGSFVCKKISLNLGNGKKLIESVIFISSYGEQLCTKKDEVNSKRILLETIIQPFVERIQMEISLLYLKNLDNK